MTGCTDVCIGPSNAKTVHTDSGMPVFGPWNRIHGHLKLVFLKRDYDVFSQTTVAGLAVSERDNVEFLTLGVGCRKVDVGRNHFILQG